MLNGFQKYLAEGLNPPPCVTAASETYIKTNDHLGAFMVSMLDVIRNQEHSVS
jgi:phage/plasmid-associated DNA primase